MRSICLICPICLVPTICLPLAAQAAYQPRADLDQGRFLKALSDAEARLAKNAGDALALASKAQALCALVRLPEAEAAARRAVEIKPDLPDALMARALVSGGKAVQQRNLGSIVAFSQAMDDLKLAAKLDPAYPLALATLGIAYQQLPGIVGGSTKKALECAERLKAVQPSKGLMLHAQILSMGGRWGEAQPLFRQALHLSSDDPLIVASYLDALGEKATMKVLGEEAQKQRLAAEARRLLPKAKKSARGTEAVSQALFDAGLEEEAWNAALGALPGADAPSILKLQLGKLAARAGIHREDGLAFLAEAAEEPLEGGTGGYAQVHWRMGQILKDMGRPDEAMKAAKEALRHNPGNKGARELMDSLSGG
jgi:tetratricopeptide (TPR) repeat protein